MRDGSKILVRLLRQQFMILAVVRYTGSRPFVGVYDLEKEVKVVVRQLSSWKSSKSK